MARRVAKASTELSEKRGRPSNFSTALIGNRQSQNWRNQTWDRESTNPLPSDFIRAYSRLLLRRGDRETLGKPFTKKWKKVWVKIAKPKQYCTKDRFEIFDQNQGFNSLRELASRGANPNFILSLFVRYLWVEEIPVQDTHDLNLKWWTERLEDLQGTRETYNAFTRAGGVYHMPASPSFQRTLGEIEGAICRILRSRDLPRNIHRQPRDKINRVVFTIVEHLRNACGGPQWNTLGELLESAIASGTFGTKRIGPGENPSSFITPLVKNFQRTHPKQAKYITTHVLPVIPNRSFPL